MPTQEYKTQQNKSQVQKFLELFDFKYKPKLFYTILKFIRNLMRRHFLRPFFHLHEPFFIPRFRPIRIRYYTPIEHEANNDPNVVFDQFFKENPPQNHQKQFFDKHFPSEKQHNPYQVLGLKTNATMEEVKSAYREQAIKYHPKNNSEPQAEKKFQEVAEAYEEIKNKKMGDEVRSVSMDSFFSDFQKKMDELFSHHEKQQEKIKDNFYSQSSVVEESSQKNKKVIIQKQYKKDGKMMKVKREENYLPDGTCQVTQTFDDGAEVKKKTFVEKKEQKLT